MRKILSLIIIGLLCLSMFSIRMPQAMGWAGAILAWNHHGEMTRDALEGLVNQGLLGREDIGKIPEYSNEVDDKEPHCIASCHRVREYQDEFQQYGGKNCSKVGAEYYASAYISLARRCYAEGNIAEAQRCLGYAIHYIQDAVCPPHVFPFAEKPYLPYYLNPHLNFEEYAARVYGYRNWPSLVKNAPVVAIASPQDLREKVLELAKWVKTLSVSYLRQWKENEIPTVVIDPRIGEPGLSGWKMSDENIGKCIEKAASLVKGAVLYARFGGPPPRIDVIRELNILTPTCSMPAMAGDPSNPNDILVSVEWLPQCLLDPLLVEQPTFFIEINYQPAKFEPVNLFMRWIFGIYTFKVTPPTQLSEGLYDLRVSATFGLLEDSDIEIKAVHYVKAPSLAPVEKGLAWLRTRQYSDGSWCSNVGVTSLAVLAFLNAGYDETDTTVSKAINYIRNNVRPDGSIYGSYPTYETSLAILALVATRNDAYKTTIENAKSWLVNSQWDESCIWGSVSKDHWYYGGFGYGWGYRPDLSNSQFALLALDAAGLPKDHPLWIKAQVFLHRCQNINFPITLNIEGVEYTVQPYNFYGGYDGGFIYYPGTSLAGGQKSYGSMTGAGIWGLLLSGVSKTDARVVAAMNWVKNHYTWDTNPGLGWSWPYYYYLSMSKALTMYGQTTIDGHDWYQELYNKIVGMQIDIGSGQGYWSTSAENFNPDLTTAYAILSLQTRAVAPPVQRLSYLTFILRSNCLIRIIDPDGNLVGYNYMTGLGENNISTAVYSGPFFEPQYIVIVNPKAGTYRLELIGISEGPYTLTIQGNYGEDVTDTFEYTGEIKPAELHGSEITVTAIVGPIDIYANPPEFEETIDNIPPTTTLEIGEPKYFGPTDNIYVSSVTPFTLTAEDNPGGTGVASTFYRIYNSTYDTGWMEYSAPFYLTSLSDGEYSMDYYSTDNIGNIEPTQTISINLDNSGPLITIEKPPAGWALQDGVTFTASTIDSSGTHSLNFSIREVNGDQGIPVGFEDMPATYNGTTGKWELFFDTLQLPDGFYIVLVTAEDNLGHTASITVPYSIRNWAVLELLPATPNNKAGRTMPVKFALRVAASVDPNQPFVYNEELTIKIYATDNPTNILQTSTFGDTAQDYRINTLSEHYITNFKTLKTPKTYVVEVWRKNMLIGSFEFSTVK